MGTALQKIRRTLATWFNWLKRPLAPSAKNKFIKKTEIGLWLAGATLLIFCAYSYAHAAIHQSHQTAQINSLRAQIQARADGNVLNVSDKPKSVSGFLWHTEVADQLWEETAPLGILEIPRLDITAVAEEGVDTHTLGLSVGHVAKSAYPGQFGNSAFAAHRDTYFRNLESIQTTDQILFKSLEHDYRYRVISVKIVDANDTSVLADTPQSTITLITCYPFHYIGSAPQRFVVTAQLEK